MKKTIVILLIALLGLLVVTGCEETEEENGDVEVEVHETDVVVVGAGSAGMMAAMEVADLEKDVILLEKMSFAGGSTARAGGSFLAVGSSINEKLDMHYPEEDLVEFLMEESDGTANEELLRRVISISGETADLMMDRGIELDTENLLSGNPKREELWRVQAEGGGSGLALNLVEAVENKDIDLRYDSPATELLHEDGVVTGVVVEGPEETYHIQAEKVILATGGFARDEALFAELLPDYADNVLLTATGNTGDAIDMTRELDSTLVGDGVLGIFAVNERYGYMGDIGSLIWESALYVNKEATRFCNEREFYVQRHQALNEQTDKLTYGIFDSSDHTESLEEAVEAEVAFKGDTLEELADAVGIDPDTFTNTVETYNHDYEAGEDSQFGMSAEEMTPVTEGPFYALKIRPATMGTIPGLKVDVDTRVLNQDGEPIPNLFAAGETVIGNMIMDEYPSSGMGIGSAFFTGRIAAMEAVAEIE